MTTGAQETENKNKATTLKQVVNTLKERITLSGYAQFGYTYDAAIDRNEFDTKRAILTVQGEVTKKLSCTFMYSLVGTPQYLEMYADYRFLPELQVRAGAFKTPFTIENLISLCDVELINCCSQAVNYLAGINGSDPLHGARTGRDLGIMLYGDLWNRRVSYNFALMNGQGINISDRNNHKDWVGSITVRPFTWLDVCGSFIQGIGHATADSPYNPTVTVGENYTRNRYAAGFYVRSKPVDVRSEYLVGKDGTVQSNGYYATLSAHVLPKFDLIASVDYFNPNKALTEVDQTNYTIGTQYWFYPRCRVQAQYTHRRSHKANQKGGLLQMQLQFRF
jgi:hypothetical protein